MKLLVSLAVTTLVALPAAAQLSFPLGHHEHGFRIKTNETITSTGWDPSYSPSNLLVKERILATVPTYPVGLPGNLEPGDLPNTACPKDTLIDDPSDVQGLPTVKLSGIGTVPLIVKCNRSGDSLRVFNGMIVAVYASAFRKIDYSGGNPNGSMIFLVDSLVNAGGSENAGVVCGGIRCRVAYSEVLGGDDSAKGGQDDIFYRSHLHGYDRDPAASEHNDGFQTQGSARDVTLINVTIDGPSYHMNAPVWVSDGPVTNFRVAESLLIGGTHSFKVDEKTFTMNNIVLWNSRIAADQLGTSFMYQPCSVKTAAFQGEGNKATDGSTSGLLNFEGNSWDFGACNGGAPVSSGNKQYIASTANDMETWVSEIRAAAGAPTSAFLSLSVSPDVAYTATPVVLTAKVTGCQPSLYEFECGDDAAFDDGTGPGNVHDCGTMPMGVYAPAVRAVGGTCESPLEGKADLTVWRPPAPTLY